MSFQDKLDFRKLYRNLMVETQQRVALLGDYIPKWKKDLLIYLLMKSKEKPCSIETKKLRRIVNEELDIDLTI